jgi:hypothetical protein
MDRDPTEHPEPFFRRREGVGSRPSELTPGQRLASTFDLHDAALTLIAERTRRENAGATEADVVAAQIKWLSEAEAPPAPWFRRRQR